MLTEITRTNSGPFLAAHKAPAKKDLNMNRLENLSQQAAVVLVERRGEILDVNCPEHAIRLWLRPINYQYYLAGNILPMGRGFVIRGWLCGMPTRGILIQQHEFTVHGRIHFGYIHPSKFPDDRRRILIPVPPPPRRAFFGYIESVKPYNSWGLAARCGA